MGSLCVVSNLDGGGRLLSTEGLGNGVDPPWVERMALAKAKYS